VRRSTELAFERLFTLFERPIVGPIVFGACIVGGVTFIRFAPVVPWAIVFGAWEMLAAACKAIAAAMLGGAMGGAGYVLVRRAFLRVPVLGAYLAGIATVGAYLGSILLVLPWIDAESVRTAHSAGSTVVFVGVTLIGGTIVGGTLFRAR